MRTHVKEVDHLYTLSRQFTRNDSGKHTQTNKAWRNPMEGGIETSLRNFLLNTVTWFRFFFLLLLNDASSIVQVIQSRMGTRYSVMNMNVERTKNNKTRFHFCGRDWNLTPSEKETGSSNQQNVTLRVFFVLHVRIVELAETN
jgi:hypothetical protein